MWRWIDPSRTIRVTSSATATSSVWPANVPGEQHVALGPEPVHDVGAAAQRRDREAVAERLAERREVRRDAEAFLRAARRVAEAGDDLVEDQDGARVGARLAERLEEARAPAARRPALWKIGSRMTAAIESSPRGRGRPAPPAASLYSRTTTRSRTSSGMPADAATGTGSSASVGEVVAPRDVVVPAVVVALELQDPLAAGERPGEADRVVGRLRPGAAEHDPLGRRDHRRRAARPARPRAGWRSRTTRRARPSPGGPRR